MSTATKTWPDEKGRFGPYGGRYVPETLVAPLEELERAYDRCAQGSVFSKRARLPAQEFRRAPHAAAICFAIDRALGRPAHLHQARRPAAHRRAQNQQLHRSGLACCAYGQAPHHRGNGRGSARRSDGDGCGAIGPRMRRLHGRRRHGAPAAQRLPHAFAGRGSGGRELRHAHAEGRDQRSDARLGHQCAHARIICLARCWERIRIR